MSYVMYLLQVLRILKHKDEVIDELQKKLEKAIDRKVRYSLLLSIELFLLIKPFHSYY